MSDALHPILPPQPERDAAPPAPSAPVIHLTGGDHLAAAVLASMAASWQGALGPRPPARRPALRLAHGRPLNAVAVSEDGGVVHVGGAARDDEPHFAGVDYNARTGTERYGRTEGPRSMINSLAFAPAAGLLFSAWADGSISASEPAAAAEHPGIKVPCGIVGDLSVSADGAVVAFVTVPGHIWLWQRATSTIEKCIVPAPSSTWGVAVAATGRTLAYGYGRYVRVENVVLRTLVTVDVGDAHPWTGLAASKDCAMVAAAHPRDLVVVDLGAMAVRTWRPPGAAIHAVSVAPDGRTVVVGLADGSLAVLDPGRATRAMPAGVDAFMAKDGANIGSPRFRAWVCEVSIVGARAGLGGVRALAWSADSSTLAVAHVRAARVFDRGPSPLALVERSVI